MSLCDPEWCDRCNASKASSGMPHAFEPQFVQFTNSLHCSLSKYFTFASIRYSVLSFIMNNLLANVIILSSLNLNESILQEISSNRCDVRKIKTLLSTFVLLKTNRIHKKYTLYKSFLICVIYCVFNHDSIVYFL